MSQFKSSRAKFLFAAFACAASAGAQAESRTAESRPRTFRLVFVRHAESEGNVRPLDELDDATKNRLTKRGEGQALEAAALLRDATPDVFATSPAGRCRTTAETLAKGRAHPPADPASAATVVEAVGPLKDGVGGDGKPFPIRARIAAWRKGEDVRPKDGESLDDVRARVVAYVRGLAKDRPTGTALVVAHGEVGAGLVAEATGRTALDVLMKDGFRNASVHLFDVHEDGRIAFLGPFPVAEKAASRPESRAAAR